MFEITEDNLTNAIFNNSALEVWDMGTEAEARAYARALLAGPTILAAAKEALVALKVSETDGAEGVWEYEIKSLQIAIAAAEAGE